MAPGARLLDQPALLHRRLDEARKQRMRLKRLGFEFGAKPPLQRISMLIDRFPTENALGRLGNSFRR